MWRVMNRIHQRIDLGGRHLTGVVLKGNFVVTILSNFVVTILSNFAVTILSNSGFQFTLNAINFNNTAIDRWIFNNAEWTLPHPVYRVSQEECARLRKSVPYVKVYRYNPKHICPKLNGNRDIGQRKVWSSGGSTHCTCQLTILSMSVLECSVILRQFISRSL